MLCLAYVCADELSQMYPEEYELIHENLLFAQGLDSDGNQLPGAESVEKDADKALLKVCWRNTTGCRRPHLSRRGAVQC